MPKAMDAASADALLKQLGDAFAAEDATRTALKATFDAGDAKAKLGKGNAPNGAAWSRHEAICGHLEEMVVRATQLRTALDFSTE